MTATDLEASSAATQGGCLATAISTVVAVCTALIAYHQVQISETQSKIMQRQTEIMRRQIDVAEAAPLAERISDFQLRLAKLGEGEVVSESFETEIVEWSQSATPYSIDSVSNRPISRERGRLLISLANAKCDVASAIAESNFTYANLRGARFKSERPQLVEAYLEHAVLDKAVLTNANLTSSDLTGASLIGAFLDGANLTDAVLAGANLQDADLRGAVLNDTDLLNANLSGVRVDRKDWLDFVASPEIGANLNRDKWRVNVLAPDRFEIRKSGSW